MRSRIYLEQNHFGNIADNFYLSPTEAFPNLTKIKKPLAIYSK
jgi:hypothetical protein